MVGSDWSDARLVDARVERADVDLNIWLAARRGEGVVSFGAAKQIAALALIVGAVSSTDRDGLTGSAAAVVGARLGLTKGSLRKNLSEARAILDFLAERGDAALRESAAYDALADLSLPAVRRWRAARLQGASGGRPARAQAQRTLAALRDLMSLARRDGTAARQLDMIRAELLAQAGSEPFAR